MKDISNRVKQQGGEIENIRQEIRKDRDHNNIRFNNQDARFNIQDKRIRFTEDALKEIRGKIEDLGKDRAKNINIEDITPEPLP
jgi:hypothetical protein